MDVMQIIKSFKEEPCSCGRQHETAVKDVHIGSGIVSEVGQILKANGFPKKLLIVADKNTLKAAEGIVESLEGFELIYHVYDYLRIARMEHVREVEKLIRGENVGVLSVGTGSVNDTCRLATANEGKMLCIFATAPSMDGFASYSSPIVDGFFKASYPAKSPEVIIADTKILAAAPSHLKSAGFGDMMAKYIGLVDWQISSLLTDEFYCEKIAALTRAATDELMSMADRVCVNDEETAGKIFESLLKTGLGMSFAQNSRPASGSEHIIAHLLECFVLAEGIEPLDFHGDDVGVCTLAMMKYYSELAKHEKIKAHKEAVDWNDVYSTFAEMADDIKALNTPDTITDAVDPDKLEECWGKIREIIGSIPSYEECKSAMERAGCKITYSDLGKTKEYFDKCVKYSPYMRRRLTLLRLRDMIDPV